MSASKGYSLDQLLRWSVEDHLIDGFERREDRLVIIQGQRRRELRLPEARELLKRLFRESPPEGQGPAGTSLSPY